MQFEAKTYTNQGKGFEEVTRNFHYKFSIRRLPKMAFCHG